MSKLKLGMVGCGWVRPQHMAGIFEEAPGVEVTAASDIDPHKLGEFCDRYRIDQRFTDPEEMFAKAGVDAVSIAIKPESAKVRLAIAAMKQGLHVLAEKPMALTVAEAEEMAKTAKTTGRILQIGFNRRFEVVYRKVVELIRNRELFGSVATAAVDYGSSSTYPYVQFMSQFPHTFDMLQYFAGKVASVRSVCRREFDEERFAALEKQLGHASEVEYNRTEPGLVALSVATTLRFASGAIGTLRLAGHSPGGRLGSDRFEIVGTRGAAVVVESMDRAVFIEGDGKETVISSSTWSRKISSFGLEYRHFAECVGGAEPTVITLQEALDSVTLYDAFLRSLQTGEEIVVP